MILAYAWASTQLLIGDPARYEEPGLYEEADLEMSSGGRRGSPSQVLAFAGFTLADALRGSGSGESPPEAPTS